jgi:hypothetical protein
VLQVIFQPSIDATQRTRRSADRAVALTSEAMIMLEEANVFQNYGMVIRCLPYRSICGIRFEPACDWVSLRLNLAAPEICEETAMPMSISNAVVLRDTFVQFTPSIPVLWGSVEDPSLVESTK